MESNSSTEIKYYEIPVLSNYILDKRKQLSSDEDTDIYLGIEKDTEKNVVFKLKKIKSHDSHIFVKNV